MFAKKISFTKNFLIRRMGFTLVEVVVSLAIFLLIVYLTASMIGSYGTPSLLTQATIFLNAQARQAASRISGELLQASSSRTFIEDNGTDIRFSVPVEYANGTLKRSPGGDLLWGDRETEGYSIKYLVNNGNLTRQILDTNLNPVAGKELIVAQNITNFNITLNSTYSQYEFNLTVSLDNYSGTSLPEPMNYTLNFAVIPQN